jgi:hypothetical protein
VTFLWRRFAFAAVEHLEKLGRRILITELVKLLDGQHKRRIGLGSRLLSRLAADLLSLASVGLGGGGWGLGCDS